MKMVPKFLVGRDGTNDEIFVTTAEEFNRSQHSPHGALDSSSKYTKSLYLRVPTVQAESKIGIHNDRLRISERSSTDDSV